MRRVLARLVQLVLAAGIVGLLVLPSAPAAEPAGVVLNEVNCTGTDWIELVNAGGTDASIGGWLLTDDALDRVPLRDTHRLRLPADTVLTAGARLVVNQGTGGFPFGLSCGDDTLRLADADDTPVDSFVLPVLASGERTWGRIPDGAGTWSVTLPTAGAANVVAADEQAADPAWLYDPLQVTEIDLEATPAALAQLDAAPGEYVEARITMRHGGETYGPYLVGLHLKGHGTFRTLAGKAAFKVKFGYAVPGQRFDGLKGLTLNNMAQDPSMISEATSSLLARALGVPTARVGYAYVPLNHADYGLYADVENTDAVMAQHWFSGTQHIYDANYANDAIPGRTGEYEIDEGSTTDISDLDALAAAAAGGASGWFERVQTVADLAEMTRAWALEHYLGHWDGYSIGATEFQPNNYFLHSDLAGRFSLVPTGTDQTWSEHTPFGVYGKGVLMRGCVADAACRKLYVDALQEISRSAAIDGIAAQARAIRAVVAPWRALDPRREQTVVAGDAQAGAEIATMEQRPSELAAWLASPSFAVAEPPVSWGSGGSGTNDLHVTGTVTPASSPVGGSHVWRLQVTNAGGGIAFGVVVDVQLSPNIGYGFSQLTRGTGCIQDGSRLHCVVDVLGPAGSDTSTGELVIGTNVTGAGEVSLTATASFADTDPTPTDNTVVLKANTPLVTAPATPPVASLRPLLGRATEIPANPVAGRPFSLTLAVTRSDTRTPLVRATMACAPLVAGRLVEHVDSLKAGKVRLSLTVPRTAKGKLLKVELKVTAAASGLTARHTYVFRIR